MAQGDLTSLANVKSWLGITTTNSDVVLARLITAASASIPRYLSRPYLGSTLITERYDGRDNYSLSLRHGPVTSVVSIQFDGVSITSAASGNPPRGGYLIAPGLETVGSITLTDRPFCRGKLNVLVSYWAGYLVPNEAHTAATTVTASQNWLTDAGVSYATGAAMTPVSGAPAVGQYAVNAGTYTFNAADAGQGVLISYGTCPPDLEQVVIEIIGEEFKRMDRIGLVSKTLASQEVIAFSQLPLNRAAQGNLDRFRRTAPY